MTIWKKAAAGLICIAVTLVAWHIAFPTRVAGVHYQIYSHDGKYDENVIVVSNFPITKYGRLWWWQQNQSWIKQEFNTPGKPLDVLIMHIDSGYLQEGYASGDAYCYADMDTEENCVNKSFLMHIKEDRNGEIALVNRNYIPDRMHYITGVLIMILLAVSDKVGMIAIVFFPVSLYLNKILWKKKKKIAFSFSILMTLALLLVAVIYILIQKALYFH